jgi:hypothetical protein
MDYKRPVREYKVKPEDKIRSRRLIVMLTPPEKLRLSIAAKMADVTMSEYVRDVVFKTLIDRYEIE